MKHYATYLRVSTQKQGKTMLGIEAQRKMCSDFVSQNSGEISHEFMDVESGTHRNRKGLQDAIMYCKKNNCPLVIAKLDRLARDVEFCFRVINTGIEIHFTDMPTINTLLLGVFASVAQYERELTSDRTKKALAVKKAQGCKLGASSEIYRANYNNKPKQEIVEMANKRGETRRLRHQQDRNVVAMVKIIRKVFPYETLSEDPKDFEWRHINCKEENRVKILGYMKDFADMDETGALFRGWDFSDIESNNKTAQKLRSYMQKIRGSFKTV